MSNIILRQRRRRSVHLTPPDSLTAFWREHEPEGYTTHSDDFDWTGMSLSWPPEGYPSSGYDPVTLKFTPVDMTVIGDDGLEDHHAIISDASAPYVGTNNVYVQSYPGSTTYGGNGIGSWRNLRGFSESQPFSPPWKRMYVSVMMGLFGSGGANYSFATSGQEKFIYTGNFNVSTGHKGSFPIGLAYAVDGHGRDDGICGLDVTVQSEGPLGTYVLACNGPGRIHTECYNLIQFLFEMSDINTTNGKIKAWVRNGDNSDDDGLILDYNNVEFTNVLGEQIYIGGINWETVRNGPGDLTCPGGQSRKFNRQYVSFKAT